MYRKVLRSPASFVSLVMLVLEPQLRLSAVLLKESERAHRLAYSASGYSSLQHIVLRIEMQDSIGIEERIGKPPWGKQ